MTARSRYKSLAFVLLGGILLAVGPGQLAAQGKYAAVSEADVIALKLNHYFSKDKKGHSPDFEWSFTKSNFIVKKGKGPIPADLLEQLSLAGKKVDEIRGTWKLEGQNGQKLVLADIQADGRLVQKDVNFPIYRTAPTVVRIGEPQYVFAVSK